MSTAASLRVIAEQAQARVYGFDSFDGLPEDWVRGEGVRPCNGEHSAVEQEERSRYFSMFLDTSQRPTTRRRPKSRSCTLDLMWYPLRVIDGMAPVHTPPERPSVAGWPAFAWTSCLPEAAAVSLYSPRGTRVADLP